MIFVGGYVVELNKAKYAMPFCIKMLINAVSKTEANEVLNSYKTGTFDI